MSLDFFSMKYHIPKFSHLQEKSLDFTDMGSAVKLETKQPHFVSLGGGRLSVGVSIIPVKKGKPHNHTNFRRIIVSIFDVALLPHFAPSTRRNTPGSET